MTNRRLFYGVLVFELGLEASYVLLLLLSMVTEKKLSVQLL